MTDGKRQRGRRSNEQNLLRMQRIREWLRDKPVGQAFEPAFHFPELREFTRADLNEVWQRQRRLPHWELEGSTYFITFRVRSNLRKPFQLVNSQRQARKPAPHSAGQTPHPVGQAFHPVGQAFHPVGQAFQPVGQAFQPAVLADRVEESVIFGHGERYLLDAYVIMSDHVHLLLSPLPGWTLAKIQQGLKGFTARGINKVLGRKGPFWQDENFDHLIRHEEDWLDKFNYIHNNPITAGLVDHPSEYPYSSLVVLHGRGRLESLPHIPESLALVQIASKGAS